MKRKQSLQVYSQEKSLKGAENDCSRHRKEACVSGAQWVRGAWWVVPQKWQGSDVYGFAFLESNEGASRGWE